MTEKKENPFLVKVYVVMIRHNTARPGEPNRSIVAVKLSQKAAKTITDSIPGTYIERFIADKSEDLTSLFKKDVK